jgi:polar amino acid transport system substrate-binding protein
MRWVVIFMFLAAVPMTLARAESLTIYCEDDPPNQMLGPDGQLTGMSVEITAEIQKRTGNRDPIQLVPWARGYDAVQKVPNTVLFSMSRTAERNAHFHWIGPILESSYAFYARADSTITIRVLEDAKRLRRIGVYNNDVRDTFLTQAGFTNLDRASNNLQNFRKLMAGRLDVYASTPISIEDEARAAGYQATDVKHVFTFMQVQLYIVLSKGTADELVRAWSEAFASLRKDGTFARIHKKYYPSRALPGKAITEF